MSQIIFSKFRKVIFVILIGLVGFCFVTALYAGDDKTTLSRQQQIQKLRQARKKAAHRKRRIIYNNDGGEIISLKKADAKTLLKARTTGISGKQVDTIVYSTWGSGFGYFTHNTKVGQIFVNKDYGHYNNKTAEFIAQGTDPLKIMVEFCRGKDIEIFWSMRMNDTHDAWDHWYGPLMFPQLKRDHPEWLVASFREKSKHGGWTAVDYNHKEIRDLALKYVEEVCLNYDIDGVDLDYFRHPVLFKGPAWGNDATEQELNKLTEMMQRIRKMTERVGLERGKPILVTVRVPDSVGYCKAIGIDIVRWLDEGLIDILVTTGYFRLNPWETSVELGHKYDVPVYPCLEDTRVGKDRTLSYEVRRTTECYRARAANALIAGCDGIYIYNIFKPHLPIWNELGDLKALETMDKVYTTGARRLKIDTWLNNGERRFLNRSQLTPGRSAKLQQDKAFSMDLNVGQKPSKDKQGQHLAKVELQLHLVGLDNTEDVVVKFNGDVLNVEVKTDAVLNLDVGYSKPRSVKTDDWVTYSIEPEVIKQGANKCEVTLTSGSLAEDPVLKDILLWVRYPSSSK